MTLEDALHYSPEDRLAILGACPEWEKDARIYGLPGLGTGAVFPVKESDLRCESFEIPAHYRQIVGLDFGYDHPFAAVRCAWDLDNDVWYIVSTYRESGQSAPIHVAAIRPWGTWIPVAWPHDGLQHDKGSGAQLAEQYRGHGLNLLYEHATHEKGGFGVEAGVQEMLERMQTARWKVFPGNGNELWFEEFRLYHRENFMIVKIRDDCLSATRIACMMRRFAEQKPGEKARSARPALRTQHAWMT